MENEPYIPLSDDMGAEPLDLQSFNPSEPPPPQDDKKQWIKLALIAPLLAKAGPGALEGFLSGLNQSRLRQEQTSRTTALDTQRQQQAQALEQYRRDTLAGQQQTRQQQLLKQYQDALANASTPDEVQAIRAAYVQQAQTIGMRPGAFESLALTQTPDKLQAKRIKSVWEKLPAESKQEALKNGWSLNVDGQPVPFDQWSQAVGGTVDPATGKPGVAPVDAGPKSDYERGLERWLKGKGKTFADSTPELELQYRREVDATQRDPKAAPGGQDPRAVATFNQIAGAYERSPLIRAADRTIVLKDAIKSVKADPSNASAQLSMAYSYIQALDTYQSAVREGELQNLGVLGTRLQQLAVEANRIATTGAFIPPEVAMQMAASGEQLANTIDAGMLRKRQEFASRAKVSGVGDMWDQFVGGFSEPSSAPPPTAAPITLPDGTKVRRKK